MSTATLPLISYLANFVLLCHRYRSISFSVELTIKYKDLLKITTIKPNYSIKILPRNGVMSDKKYKQADLSNYFKSSSSKVTSRKRKHSGSDTEDMSNSYADQVRKNSKHDHTSSQSSDYSFNSMSSQSSQYPKLENSSSMTATSGSIQSVSGGHSSGARHMHHQSFSNPSSSGTAFDHSPTTSTSEDSQSASGGPSIVESQILNRSYSNSSSKEGGHDNYNASSSSSEEDNKAKQKTESKRRSSDSFDRNRKSSNRDSSSSEEDYDAKNNHSKNEKGNSSKNFDPDDKPNADSVKLKPLENRDNHVVLFPLESSLKGNDHPKRNEVNRNEFYYVILPCDYNPEFKSDKGDSRWDIIQTELRQNIPGVFELEEVILSYNQRFKSTWKFDTLYDFFDKYVDEDERYNFFLKTLPKIITLALRVEKLFPKPIPILKQNKSMKITMTQEQAACLLANAFLCTFPHRRFNKKGAGLPDINFSNLYSDGGTDRKIEKLKCLVHYFKRVTTKMPKGRLTFSRQCIRSYPDWEHSDRHFTKLKVIEKGSIEDEGDGMLQADFANKFVGGGVLGKGLVQEEIRFIICPEMIVSRLFTEVLGDQEVLIMTGCERFSNYSGYSDTFKFTGNYQDKTPRDSWDRRMVDVVAMDALVIRTPKTQFQSHELNRELQKAYCAFNNEYRKGELSLGGKPSSAPVCTGNWGCGAFRGDKQLKAVIQMMAASEAGRDIYYCTFGDAELSRDLKKLYSALIEYGITVKKMMQWISEYRKGTFALKSSLFHYIFKQFGIRDSD